MTSFTDLVGNFLFIGLIVIGLFSWIVTTQSDNDITDPIINDPLFNQSFYNLQEEIESAGNSSTSQYEAFNEEVPKPGFFSIVLFGIVSVGKTFSNIIFGFFTILIKLPLMVLGIPVAVSNLILTWLIILVVATAWILYKLGG